jgi:hypothetical protein
MDDLSVRARRVLNAAIIAAEPPQDARERIRANLAKSLGAFEVPNAAPARVGSPPTRFRNVLRRVRWAAPAVLGTLAAAAMWAQREPEQRATLPAANSAVLSAPPPSTLPASPEVAVPSSEPLPRSNAPASDPPTVRRSPVATVPSDSLREEAALLHEARKAQRSGANAEALRILADHSRRYPESQLGTERALIRVLALCALGRDAEARSIARRLLNSPHSAARAALARSCVGE